jgi:Mn-dependent DtxR family transcriptional regulator
MHTGNQKMINNLLNMSDTNNARVKWDPDGLSGAKILKAIADDKSWILFSTIAMSSDSNGQQGDGSQTLLSKLNLTRKQYYQRINRLTSSGLINRKNGRYSLSSFGKIIYEIQKTIETAIQYRWRFVAIDSLESSHSAEGMSVENKIKIINALLGDHDKFKSIFLNRNGNNLHITK